MSTCNTSRVTPVNNLIKTYEKGGDRIVKHPSFNLPCIGFQYQKANQKPQIKEQTKQWAGKRTKGETMIYRTQHRKLKIE